MLSVPFGSPSVSLDIEFQCVEQSQEIFNIEALGSAQWLSEGNCKATFVCKHVCLVIGSIAFTSFSQEIEILRNKNLV